MRQTPCDGSSTTKILADNPVAPSHNSNQILKSTVRKSKGFVFP